MNERIRGEDLARLNQKGICRKDSDSGPTQAKLFECTQCPHIITFQTLITMYRRCNAMDLASETANSGIHMRRLKSSCSL